MAQFEKSQKLIEYEILRAVSIVLLLFAHTDIYSLTILGLKLEPIGPYSRSFFLGAFFFMAGYFTESTYTRAGQSYFGYLWKKVIRFIPPYWLSLLMFMTVLGFSLKRFDFGVYVLDLQFILSPTYVKPLLTLWYLSVVLSYYVLLGFVLLRPIKVVIIYSALVFIICLILNLKYGLFDPRFFEFYFVFIVGLLFSRTSMGGRVVAIPVWIQIPFFLVSGIFYWFYCLKDYQIVTLSYLLFSFLFSISSVVLALRIFKLGILHWRIWQPISYAAFFAYLFHRPIWEIMFMLIKFPWPIYSGWYRLLPGSIIVFVISYYMQFGYDLLLKTISDLWKRLTLKAV